MPIKAWQSAQRLLCIRLDSLGDVLMSTPAIRALRQAAPNRHITLLTSPSGGELADLLPDVDRCLVYEAPWMKATPNHRAAAQSLDLIERLRASAFDAAVIFTVYSQSPLPAALCCYLADIPLRLAHCRENPYQLLTDWIPDDEPEKRVRHEARRQLDLVASVGCLIDDERLRTTLCDRAVQYIHHFLADEKLDASRPWLVVHPGASAPSRRYPPELFAHVVEDLVMRHNFRVVLTGSNEEQQIVDTVASKVAARTISLVGKLALSELAALLALAPVLLTNNTGPVHIAAAVGTPVVDLYALTNPQHTPWLVPHRVLSCDVPCKYCYKSRCPEGHHRCLRGIEPLEVVDAVLELYEQSVKRGRSQTAIFGKPAIETVVP